MPTLGELCLLLRAPSSSPKVIFIALHYNPTAHFFALPVTRVRPWSKDQACLYLFTAVSPAAGTKKMLNKYLLNELVNVEEQV